MTDDNEPTGAFSRFLNNIWGQLAMTTVITVVWLIWIVIEILGVF
ncbi:MAG: hypothetical protein ACW981_11760 [Candidatus Hodarchaeales archaeon]|jgi:hypothetical protein